MDCIRWASNYGPHIAGHIRWASYDRPSKPVHRLLWPVHQADRSGHALASIQTALILFEAIKIHTFDLKSFGASTSELLRLLRF